MTVRVAQTWRMAERVFVRDLEPAEGNKLLSTIRRGSGSVVRWRRSQIVLWSAQRMSVAQIAEIAFTSQDRVREVIHNFNADGFESLAPKYVGGGHRSSRCPNDSRSRRSACLGRRIMVCRSRPGRSASWLSSWSLRGWSTTSAMRAFGFCSVRRACRFK